MMYDTGTADADRFVTTPETDILINTAYKELYGALTRYGMQRTESEFVITATGATSYTLPDDFWALLSVHRLDDSGTYFELGRHDQHQRPSTSFNADALTYRLVGVEMELNPTPLTGTYSARYIPVTGVLSDPSDNLDGVLGWEEYVVLWVAVKLLQKEGSHDQAAPLKQDMQMLMQRIQDEAQAAEMANGNVVANTRRAGTGGILPGDYSFTARPKYWF